LNLFGVAVGDYNGDGKQDLAITTNNGSDVAIYLGDGNGTFESPTPLYFGASPNMRYILAGPFQGQKTTAKPDLVISSPYAVDLLLNITP
jgi:FG-GAP-like repeat